MIDDKTYYKIVDFIESLKICYGPLFVQDTLKRHKILNKYLLDYQKRFIVDIESDLTCESE